METIIRVKSNELTLDLFKKIKDLFKNEKELEISISTVSDFGLNKNEDREEYVKRVNKAIKNLEQKKNAISLTDREFDNLTDDLLDIK